MTERPQLKPKFIDTLGALIDDDYQVALYCENPHEGMTCGFVKWLDLEKLAAKLGRDHGCLHDDLVHQVRREEGEPAVAPKHAA